MKLAVITIADYDQDYNEKLKYLQGSCDRFGIDLKVYKELGKAWDFFDAKINRLGVYINNLRNDYTHVLWTDASDSFFLTNLDELLFKYEQMGSPKLIVSSEKSCHPFGERSNELPKAPTIWASFNPGNFIAEIPTVLDALSACKSYHWLKTNDQGHWMLGFFEGKIELKIDYHCQLFQTMSDCDFEKEFSITDGKFINEVTSSMPSIIHFNGGKTENTFKLMDKIYNEVVAK